MERIHVTKTFLPPIDEYLVYLRRIWKADQLTNQGPLLTEFEEQVSSYLGVSHFHFVNNGTMALQIALNSLGITEGEVITTPFSYVATTSAILWERCTPVFVDIDPDTFCIDADKIEGAITSRTKAIMPVHVFGHPCNIERIELIAKKYGINTIYDGAHAFGAEYQSKSLLSFGDAVVCSFHATKPFHTIEGGGIILKDKKVSDRAELIKRFGHNFDEHLMLGINGKASEFQAAMGLCNLKYIEGIIKERQKISEQYDELLKGKLKLPTFKKGIKHNYSYYPITLRDEGQLLRLVKALNKQNIFPRRYFYPSLNQLPYLKSKDRCPISEDITKRVLCLPLYAGLRTKKIREVSQIISEVV